MTVRHNFFVFFAIFYFVFLALGLSAGLALGRFTGVNLGFVVNIISFCAAVQLSATRFGGRYLYIEGPGPIGLAAIISKRRYTIPPAFALIAVAIDMAFYTLSSFYFRGEFQELNPWRLVGMFGVYCVLSYLVLSQLYGRRKSLG